MPWEEANGLFPGRAEPAPGRGPGRAPGFGAAGVGRASADPSALAAGACGVAGPGCSACGADCSAAGAEGFGVCSAAGAEGFGVCSAAGWAGFFGAGFGPADVFFAGAFSGSGFAGIASRSRRCTGGSIVDDADFTNSPSSFSFAITVLLSTPSSFASSWTRTFATTLLSRPIPRQGGPS